MCIPDVVEITQEKETRNKKNLNTEHEQSTANVPQWEDLRGVVTL